MRELTVRILFTKHCLGAAKKAASDRFVFQRSPSTAIVFMASWHASNMRFAAQILGRHQVEVKSIMWDIEIDAVVQADPWFRRYYVKGPRQRFAIHEAFFPGQIIGINCVVPASISDDDFWELMRIAGQYRGLSPARPLEFGHFTVVSLRPRRAPVESIE